MRQLRITGLFTLRRSSCSGFRSPRSLRYAPFPRLTAAPFASPGLASQALIRPGKPSYTAETLCAMLLRFSFL
jgi:hypothetical protein